ncbi:hypothetical protein HWV62_34010 [Athelia sp. TMB]|nr:hypothetical protein HWV62_34010 [Athelia sp. TMB]
MPSPDNTSPLPRQFPPPVLADVPMDYIVHKLHQLAPRYWDKPDTADCTIIIPIPHPIGRPRRAPDMPLFATDAPDALDGPGMIRRATDPLPAAVPRVSFKLHMDYLSAQSPLLRGLFAGANPIDLINAARGPSGSDPGRTASRKPALPFDVPENRLPRLLPSHPAHPTLFLPVPDPTSFHLLVHWMYFGHTHYIADCLDRGVVQLPGISRNVAYLGLADKAVGKFLRRWEREWRRRNFPPSPPYGDESSGSEESDDDMDVDEEDSRRGRPTDTRRLSR